jgi:hypothetical protein
MAWAVMVRNRAFSEGFFKMDERGVASGPNRPAAGNMFSSHSQELSAPKRENPLFKSKSFTLAKVP